MMFLELFVPRGVFSAEQLRELAGRLTLRQLLTHADAIRDVVDTSEGSSANPGVMDFVDSVNHVVVHEIGTWSSPGTRPCDNHQPERRPGPRRRSIRHYGQRIHPRGSEIRFGWRPVRNRESTSADRAGCQAVGQDASRRRRAPPACLSMAIFGRWA
jgi:hypothetical protein